MNSNQICAQIRKLDKIGLPETIASSNIGLYFIKLLYNVVEFLEEWHNYYYYL